METTSTQSKFTPLTYEQEVHAVLCGAASTTEDLLRYFEAQAAMESGDAKKLTLKCIDYKREVLKRIRELIPQALERRELAATIQELAAQQGIKPMITGHELEIPGLTDADWEGFPGFEQSKAEPSEGLEQVAREIMALAYADIEIGQMQSNIVAILARHFSGGKGAELVTAVESLLEWVPKSGVGSSGYQRVERVKAALKSFGEGGSLNGSCRQEASRESDTGGEISETALSGGSEGPRCPKCQSPMSTMMRRISENSQSGVKLLCEGPELSYHEFRIFSLADFAQFFRPISESPWRPIEVAPKNGSHILAADFNGKVGFGGDPQQSFQCVVHWWEWSDGTHQDEWGWYPSTGAGDNAALADLTHYRLLEEYAGSISESNGEPKEQV